MTRLTHSLLAKIIAFFLVVIIFVITAFMAVSSIACFALSDDFSTADGVRKQLTHSYLHSNSNKLFYQFIEKNYTQYYGTLEQWAENRNYYYTIYDESKEVLSSNYKGQDYYMTYNNLHIMSESFIEDGELIEDEKEYHIQLYAKNEPTQKDLYALAMALVDVCYAKRVPFIIFSFLNILIIIAIIIFLCCAAGHKKGTDTVFRNFVDRIPLDVYTAFWILIAVLEFMILQELSYGGYVLFIAVLALCLVFDFIVIVSYILSVATRIKTNTIFKNNLIYILLLLVFKASKKVIGKIRYIIKSIPMIPKTLAVLTCFVLFNFLLAYYSYNSEVFVLVFVELLIIVPCVVYIAVGLRKLQKAGERIANGDLEHRVETRYLTGDLRSFGDSLNNIGNGLQKAVNEKIKSERLKTELITNVSHDIKTPLTSIINYVDLIKKEKPENDTVKEYIEVLDRQSGRLKKLIEDLVEASKASTGNIAVNYEPCELGVLLAQTAGEYEQRAAQNGLQIVLENDQDPIMVLADGRHLWRIFDNLMNNICKYSQPNTRVYLSLKRYNNKAVVTFRNISKSSLNVSGDELMERFVRGDSSRNTEGSGLGLSIAKSLVELQKGKMVLTVDGDLFKVLLTFDII